MRHDVDFFRDEIRDGFYIPTQVKVFWACCLDVLSEIDKVCQNHGLTYFADWGTLLGAVRHGGFVPWDDDLDICMLRDDYEKFKLYASKELPPSYSIHDYKTKENHWLFLSRVANSAHISFEEEHLSKNYNFPFIAGVDIFVKDYLSADEEQENARCKEIREVLAIADGVINGTMSADAIAYSLKLISTKYQIEFGDLSDKRAIAVPLYALSERLMAMVPEAEAENVGQIFPWVLKGGKGESKSFYKPAVYIPFEDTLIPVPACYNKVLSCRYPDYYIVHKDWDGHEYPAFESQKSQFESSTRTPLPAFTFTDDMLKKPVPDRSCSYKELCKESLSGLKLLLTQTLNSYERGDCQSARDSLVKMQHLSEGLFALIRDVKGASHQSTETVASATTSLCEDIEACLKSIFSTGTSFDKIKESLSRLDSALKEHVLNRKEALFLPIGTNEWSALASFYEKAKSDPSIDPIVVPLPLYTKDVYGNPTMSEDEIIAAGNIGMYPHELEPCWFFDYDIALHCPEIVYIQNPYDGENPLLTVPSSFFAQNLRRYAGQLIYAPIGKVDEFTKADEKVWKCLKYYVTAPGVVYADKVMCQSEHLAKQYVEKLCEFAGENTRKFWEEKMVVDGSDCTDPKKVPTKRLLYCISLSDFMERSDSLIEDVCSKLDVIVSAPNTLKASICFYPHIYAVPDALRSQIDELRANLIDCAKIRCIEVLKLNQETMPVLADCYDAYYGSMTPFVQDFVRARKPVMISDYGAEN